MKTKILSIVLGVLAVSLAGFTAINKRQSPPRTASDSKSLVVTSTDKTFISSAVEDGYLIVSITEIAIKSTSDKELKALAQGILRDQKKAIEELRTKAKKLDIETDSSSSSTKRKIADRLSSRKGDAFNKAYVSEIIAEHTALIEMYRKESANGSNMEIRIWAASKVGVLEQHLQLAQGLEKRFM